MRPLRYTFSAYLVLFLCLLGSTAGSARAADPPVVETVAPAAPDAVDADSVELYRIRIVNRKDGAIQVSTDGGASYRLIGRVLAPATTAAEGYTAAEYAAPGTVAAIAIHGIRIRVGADDHTLHDPLVLSIDPVEYANSDNTQDPNKGYGGQVTGSAGILTDIHAGASIFRDLAPLVGNAVCMERSDGVLQRMASDFRPTGTGEVYVLIVSAPRNSLTQVTFENRIGGAVTATFADGTTRDITRVVQPVLGVGRFDGTAFTGVGRINTDHTGVITISTVPVDTSHPEGEGKESRGGFQISPVWHNARLEEAGAAMVMTLGSDPGGPRKRELEGQAPLFKGAIGLGDGRPDSALCDVSIDGGAWETMPILIGSIPNAFTAAGLSRAFKAQNIDRTVTTGVTAFRLRLAPRTVEQAHALAETAVQNCRIARYAAASVGALPIVHSLLTVNANPTDASNVAYVRLLIEDTPRAVTNVAPFSLTWNTTTVPDGEYLIEADAMDAAGTVLAVTRRKVFVLNHEPPHTAAAAVTTPPVTPAAAVPPRGSHASGG